MSLLIYLIFMFIKNVQMPVMWLLLFQCSILDYIKSKVFLQICILILWNNILNEIPIIRYNFSVYDLKTSKVFK